jgi:predicted transcriptional regulator
MNEKPQLRDGLYGFEFREVDKRRAEPGERKTFNIKQLWQRNHEILNLLAMGYKSIDVAEIMGVSEACVSQTMNSDLGKAKLSEIRLGRDEEAKKTAEKIRVLTNKALATYHEIFDNENGEATLKDRKDVADTIVLELSGLRVPTKTQSQIVNTTLTKDEIEAFKDRGKKAAENAGIVIDIDAESTIHEGDAKSVEMESIVESIPSTESLEGV